MADMRFLKDDPWVYLKEKNPSLVSYGEVRNIVVHCYRGQVFVAKEEHWRFGQVWNKGKIVGVVLKGFIEGILWIRERIQREGL